MWLTTKSTCPFCRVEWEFGANTNECNSNSISNSREIMSTLSSASSFGSSLVKRSDPNNATATNPPIPRPKLRVRVKKYHGVAHWTWNCVEDDDVCGICQSPYEGVTPGAKFPGDECPVVWGKCGHSFHIQCITTWLTTKSTCPFCRVEWEFGANTNE
eukprot:CAMPEP_0204642322 /NCGR_PEP_ID=MMETSP0717-20131115/51626_1 /ASSEMBLY_ACC=CAM_ASM_000666 /TAXON_ID=230516 /ORGANISM="Chaetoceros curvisetus" /LENGTH=157 /DNA_ID=CAMNT_0051663085 /DNA_START=727 /DNA_END=1200 /DNA_ORIENTATION=+